MFVKIIQNNHLFVNPMVQPVLVAEGIPPYDFHPYDAEYLTDACGGEVHHISRLFPISSMYSATSICCLISFEVSRFMSRRETMSKLESTAMASFA